MMEFKSKESEAFAPMPLVEADTALPISPAYDIPDGGYGWVVVCGIAIINAFAWGVGSVSLPSYLREK